MIANRIVAASMGALSAMHRELLALEDDDLDPAICSIEDTYASLAIYLHPGDDPAETLSRYR